MIPHSLYEDAASLLEACRVRGVKLSIAESCTGGLVAAALTAIAGSSDVVESGFVAYSNAAKIEMLGVPAEMIARHGAVSEEVVRTMALGALTRSHASIAVSVAGIAGPGGGTPEKPVGLMCFALVVRGRDVASERRVFVGDRAEVCRASVVHVFGMIRSSL